MEPINAVACRAISVAMILFGCVYAHAADVSDGIARIAYVAPDMASSSVRSLRPLRDRLRELGWIEGKNLVLDEYRGEGSMDRLPQLMAQALDRKLDVLVTSSTPGAWPRKRRPPQFPSSSHQWVIL